MSTKRRLLVTGGPGTIGRRLILRLLEAGYEVESTALEAWPDAPCPHIISDLRRLGDAVEVIAGHETVIHLAAIRDGSVTTPAETFIQNVTSAFNVFWAAKLAGVRRVVWSSSSHATGQPYTTDYMPPNVPVREHELHQVGDTYGLCKTAAESVMAHRRVWEDLQLVALRVGFAYEAEDYEFLYEVDVPRVQANPLERLPNLWGYVDGRDVYQAFERAIENPDDIGGEILLVTAADTIMNRPTRELVAEFAPGAVIADDLAEFGSFYSLERTRQVLGYEPKHSWREFVDPS